MSIARLGIVSLLTLAALALAGCSSPHPALNPRPVIYTVSSPNRIDLCSLIPESKRSADLEIFYATNRVGSGSKYHREYGNDVDNRLHLGVATIHIGDANTTWDDICNASSGKTNGDPQFQLAGARELDDLPRNTSPPSSQPTPTAFVQAVDRQLALSPNHQINVYVHGFKTYFSWEVEVLAKLFHCTGRGSTRGVASNPPTGPPRIPQNSPQFPIRAESAGIGESETGEGDSYNSAHRELPHRVTELKGLTELKRP